MSPAASTCGDVRPELRVDRNVTTRIDLDARDLEPKICGPPAAPRREQDLLRFERAAVAELDLDAVSHATHTLPALVLHELDAEGLHRGAQSRYDLEIEERQDFAARVDERDFRAERREHAGILATDHAAPQHDHRARERLDREDLVAVVDPRIVEVHVGRTVRLRACRDQHEFSGHAALAVRRRDRHAVGAGETTVAAHILHVVARQVVTEGRRFSAEIAFLRDIKC